MGNVWGTLRWRFFLLAVVGFGLLGAQDGADDAKLYFEARKTNVKGEWERAISKYQALLDAHPDSRYADDSQFWIGYSLQKLPERHNDSWTAFATLRERYPHSPWIDDALIHQVQLADEFVQRGKSGYRKFLKEQQSSPYIGVQVRATMALARLGDAQAITALAQFKRHADYGQDVSQLLDLLNESGDDGSRAAGDSGDFQVQYPLTSRRNKKSRGNLGDQLFVQTRKYEQYRGMLQEDNRWEKEELESFGLWHILPTDEFDELYALSDPYDRSEWLRKFWKANDPTPTTGRNELREAFTERITYARAHFSDTWDYRHIKYLRDQYLRSGWPRAPWDARGELYIKFGEPDTRTFETLRVERWIYDRLRVTFLVKQFMTNIYSNALSGNSVHGGYDQKSYVDVNYIYRPVIYYQLEDDYKTLKDLSVEQGATTNAELTYRFPTKTFKRGKENAPTYFRRYTVFNEDWREVASGEDTITLSSADREKDEVMSGLRFALHPGQYVLALRIEIPGARRLGIIKHEFEVR